MAIQSTTINQPHNNCEAVFSNKDLTQHSLNQHEFTLLQMPDELLNIIMHQVSDHPSPVKSAIRAVEFGRVCTRMHLLTHQDADIHALIHNEKKFDILSEFLEDKLEQARLDAKRDPYRLRYLLREKDFESAQTQSADLIEDFKRDHPGLDEEQFVDAIENDMTRHLAQDVENERDLSNAFFAIFKETMKKMDVGPERMIRYLIRASLLLSPCDTSDDFLIKGHQALIDFAAAQPLKEMTIKSYENLIALLFDRFCDLIPNNEELLRKAIYKSHDKKEFDALIDEFSHPSDELLSKFKEQLRTEREAQRKEIEDEILTLCGDNFNGVIDASYRIMRDAEDEMNQAKDVYITSLMMQASNGPNNLVQGQQQINDTFDIYLNRQSKHQSAQSAFDSLNNRLAGLAVWTNGVITSGEKLEIEAGLQEEKLTEDAHLLCKKWADFYTQLSQPFNDKNNEFGM